MDNFSLDIFDDDTNWANAVTVRQLGGRSAPLKSSASVRGEANLSVTTLSISDIMQGAALYKPASSTFNQFNQSLSSDLKGLMTMGKSFDSNLGARAQLLPYDVMLKQGFSDGTFTMEGPEGETAPAIDGITVQGAEGLRFVDAEHLEGNVTAARDFIKKNFKTGYSIGGYVNRNIGGTSKPSDHSTGLALDVMVTKGGSKAEGQEKAMGDRIAAWFASNPDVFGVKYIIWMDRIITRDRKSEGWRAYSHPSGGSGNTVQHRDHVHISFLNTGQTAPGPMGNPLTAVG